MTIDNLETAACPFCGKSDSENTADLNPGPDMFFVVCNCCGATGPGATTRQKSRLAWNERKVVNIH